MRAIVNVFARMPRRGQVKTRLAVDIGSGRALAAYRQMLAHAMAVARAADAKRIVWVDGGGWHPAFRSVDTRPQPRGDLGHRMFSVLAWCLHRSDRAVIIGSDCPKLSPHHLDAALSLLDHHDVVVGPALDGGYYLIGARRRLPWLFRGIEWGGPAVLQQTRSLLRRHRVTHTMLEPLADVDTVHDLAKPGSQLVRV